MILREELKNLSIRNTKYDDNMHKYYALILVKYTKGSKKKLQVIKYWEAGIKNQPIGIINAIKHITCSY